MAEHCFNPIAQENKKVTILSALFTVTTECYETRPSLPPSLHPSLPLSHLLYHAKRLSPPPFFPSASSTPSH
ncbi:hypothetical protein E2C01_073152 [Portunus trituberculatus]|uniref:Uncharacterized protein n=1 Tax=Portunus trituberculatus TaxID=210409 RepID=A0A5B7ICK2_PORTR|nr:hypothetical protein [Portunus trituberculatus]